MQISDTVSHSSKQTHHHRRGNTHDAVRLAQLRTVLQRLCLYGVDGLALRQSHVHVCGRQLVHVEPACRAALNPINRRR
jgi:hypothetical protein